MIGLSRREAWVLKAFPVVILAMAAVLVLTGAFWRSMVPSDVTCWTPDQFGDSQVQYVNKICQRSDGYKMLQDLVPSDPMKNPRSGNQKVSFQPPNIAVSSTVVCLLSVALFLSIPIGVGDMLERIASSTRVSQFKDLSTVATILRVAALLANRAIAVLFFGVAAAFVRRLGKTHPSLGEVVAPGNLLSSGLFNAFRQENTTPFLCDFVIRQLGNSHRHTVQCDHQYGPQVPMAKFVVFFTWISVVTALVWLTIQSASVLLLVLLPSSRKFQLALPGELSEENRKSEDREEKVSLSRLG